MGLFRSIELPSPVSPDGNELPPVNLPQLLGRFQTLADNIETIRKLTEVSDDSDYFRMIDDINGNITALRQAIIEFTAVPAGVFWEVHRIVVPLQTSYERGGASRAQSNIFIGTSRDIRNYVGSGQAFFTASTESGTPGVLFEPYTPIMVKEREVLTIEIVPSRNETYIPAVVWGKRIKRPPEIIES